MSINQGDESAPTSKVSASSAPGDEGVQIPGSTPPLSSGRTDINPSDESGVDELPDNDGKIPKDYNDAVGTEGIPDIDPDNAELDDAPNPR